MPMATEQEAAARYPKRMERHREELRRGAEAATLGKVRRGEAVGRLPLGYEYGRDETALPDESRGRLLREAFLLAAEGVRPPVRGILADASAGGLRGRNGRPLDVSQLWRILVNPFYAGTVTYRGEAFPGRHRPLVSAGTFRRVQEGLARRGRRSSKNPKA